ncbi:hypothetical protein chiPu_0022599, partial [Chiloscyllium punctatum]|nr:hypothetical protein [Chiloscyllium punctatum]
LCRCDSVSQTPAAIKVNEGDDVLLFCNYTTTSNNAYLYWYRQPSNGSVQFLLQKDQYSEKTGNFLLGRLFWNFDPVNRTIKLNVLSTELTDSAVYYCALRPTENENWADPVQKL